MSYDWEKQPPAAVSTEFSIGSRCFYNCSCFCCLQGCCVDVCCCCCCGFYQSKPRTNIAVTIDDDRADNKPGSKVLSNYSGSRKLMLALMISLSCRWMTTLGTLFSNYLILHQNRLADSIATASGGKISVATPSNSMATPQGTADNSSSNCSGKSSNTSYDITIDQQQKNNLCKMLSNNSKGKRRCRRRRRRRRRRHSNNNNRQQRPQQHNIYTCVSKDINSITLKCCLSASTTSALRSPCFKPIKRSRANLVWLLIGLFWLEVKLINCNAIVNSGGYVSNLIMPKGCTSCQVDLYTVKDSPHTYYKNSNNNNNNNNNNKNNNNYFYKIKANRHQNNNNNKYNYYNSNNINNNKNKNNNINFYNNFNNDKSKYNNNFNNNNYNNKNNNKFNNYIMLSDQIRLESIKRQILTKLGLTHKPNVTHPMPKQFIWETLYRAEAEWIVGGGEGSFANVVSPTYAYAFSSNSNLTTNPTASDSKKQRQQEIYRKNKSSANRKSTYLIDIHRSNVYLSNHSVQTKTLKSTTINTGERKDTTEELSPPPDKTLRETVAIPESNDIEREEFFGNTQEIITFAEEGTQYQQYRIIEFAPQKSGMPKQKLSIRSAEIHIRVEKRVKKRNTDWEWAQADEPNVQIQHLIDSKRKNTFSSNLPRKRIKIWVFRMTHGVNITSEKAVDQAFLFRASFEVDTDHLGWQKFDLTETTREWYSDLSGGSLRLLIDCTGCGTQYSLHLFQWKMKTSGAEQHINPNRPFLVLHTESIKPRRVRRRAVDCGGALNGQCCKESFYVSFKALGWDDWIIAPRGYFANYCRGECTGPFRTPDTFQTFHAHFIEEYRKMGLLNGMRPCCAPVKFSSMSLIYYGDDGIIKRDLPKMVVDECGCP